MTTFAASPDPVVSAAAIIAVVQYDVTGADMVEVHRIARDTVLHPNPAERVAQHLDFAEDNAWLAVNREPRPNEPISYSEAAALHRRWAAIYATVIDLRVRRDAVAGAPLSGPNRSVSCDYCGDFDSVATTRVWDGDGFGDDPFDVEVCAGCAVKLLAGAPEWVRSEPMTEDDHARHGVHAGPELSDAWDAAVSNPFSGGAWGDDALDLGQGQGNGGDGGDLEALMVATGVLVDHRDELGHDVRTDGAA